MFNLIAGAFMSFASILGGLFGGHATSTPPHEGMGSTSPMHMGSTTPDRIMGMGIMGVVESISGTTLTVQGMEAGMHTATTTYTVDASAAKVIKEKVGTTTVSSILKGDHVSVNGKISGTTVTAEFIIDGMLPPMSHMMPMSGKGDMGGMNMGSSTHGKGWNPGGPMKPASAPTTN